MNRLNQPETPRLSERAAALARVPSRKMGDVIARLKAEGRAVLPLKGAPDWLPPRHVLEAAKEAVDDLTPQPSHGFPELRQAIARLLEREDDIDVDPESEILVTNGGMHALHVIFTTLLNPGDEVVTYSPGFFFYGSLKLAGAVPRYAATREEDNWAWDAAALERAITSRTKMIIINSPTNPTGYVATEEDLRAVADLARRHDLLVVSDEAYDKMIYNGRRHVRFASLDGVRDRVITVCSFTKSYAMQPWRLGFIVAAADLTFHLRQVLEWQVLSCNHVAQRAAQAALEGPQDWVREIAPRYQRNRDLMVSSLKTAPGISFVVPEGGPFLFIKASDLGVDGEVFSRTLMYDFGVPNEPGSEFGSAPHLRLMFGGAEDVLMEAGRRITAAARKLSE